MIIPNILVVDDEELVLWSLESALATEDLNVLNALTAREALEIAQTTPIDIALLDVILPDMNGIDLMEELRKIKKDIISIFITAYGTIDSAVNAMKLGAYDYLRKPFQVEEIRKCIRNAVESIQLKKEIEHFREVQRRTYGFDNIIGQSPAMLKVFEMVQMVAGYGATTVLLEGENGTGKDLIARAIHFQSDCHDKPFVEVNCTTMPETLVESELLGHEKGAFTDAKSSRTGLFEQAHGGTLFLDEIGDMKLDMQVKLLKLIEEKRIRRVGGNRDIPVDVRIVAATNRRLEELIKEGRFREDLYYRLAVFPIQLSPLRKRLEDIPLLVHYFIDSFNRSLRKSVKGITPEALEALREYPWPGNVRELRNVIERAMILLGQGDMLELKNLLPSIGLPRISEETLEVRLPSRGISLEAVEQELIRQALERTQNNQTHAAKLLRISRLALRYRMEKHGLL